MKRHHLCLMLAAGAATAGCNRPAHHEAKQQAEQRWSEVRARVKLQLGRQQYEGGLFEEAVATLTEALALDPRQPDAYIMLARSYLELSKAASAQQALDAARERGLDSADWHYTQGVLFEQRDQLDAAVTEYEQARQMNPGQVDFVIALAECLVSARRTDEAMQLLDESLHRFDAAASIAALAGHVALLQGDADRAAGYFAQASVDSVDPLIAEQYGLLLARQGRCEQAIAMLRPRSDAADSDGAGAALRAMARCELARGDALAAKGHLLDYAHEHPTDSEAHVLLAQAAIESDDLHTAEYALGTAARFSPNRPEIALTRAGLHFRQGEYSAAADLLYDLLSVHPGLVDGYCLLGEVLLRQRQAAEAEHCFRQAIRLDPTCAWASERLSGAAFPGRFSQAKDRP